MLKSWDTRRDLLIGKSLEDTLEKAATHWVHSAKRAIQQRGRFVVALSGGSTPKKIYERLLQEDLDWKKVWLFWSDERAVPPDNPDSNYHMAMEFFKDAAIPKHQIFRMVAESEIEKNALEYEKTIERVLKKQPFDLVMLGVGEDGHTASLFPKTKALEEKERLVIANYVEDKKCYRMTFTFHCIEMSLHPVIYALGEGKKQIVAKVLNAPIVSEFPASRIGTAKQKAIWVLDEKAADLLS